jgi:hypothetical protein
VIRITFVVLLGATISTSPTFADDGDDSQEAAAIMAAATVCNTPVAEDLKRVLYAKMLKVMQTPSQIKYEVGLEVKALNELSISDRTAMCLAIGDRAKSLTP